MKCTQGVQNSQSVLATRPKKNKQTLASRSAYLRSCSLILDWYSFSWRSAASVFATRPLTSSSWRFSWLPKTWFLTTRSNGQDKGEMSKGKERKGKSSVCSYLSFELHKADPHLAQFGNSLHFSEPDRHELLHFAGRSIVLPEQELLGCRFERGAVFCVLLLQIEKGVICWLGKGSRGHLAYISLPVDAWATGSSTRLF